MRIVLNTNFKKHKFVHTRMIHNKHTPKHKSRRHSVLLRQTCNNYTSRIDSMKFNLF